MKKVLIITYYWPPSGGSGVQRWLKMSKYLPEAGWRPVVYTAENAEYPVEDPSLEKDISPDAIVIKRPIVEPYSAYKKFLGIKKDKKIKAGFLSTEEKSSFKENIARWIRGNLFIPDARCWWVRPSVKYLLSYLANNPVDAVISTGPPHSMHLIGLKLREKTGLPWIADFRDPWTEIDFYDELRLTRWADRKQREMEREVLTKATKVVSIGWSMAKSLSRIGHRQIEIVPNGYDFEEKKHFSNPKLTDKFTLTHIGIITPSRNNDTLWEALAELLKEKESLADNLHIKLIGSIDTSVITSLEKSDLRKYSEIIDHIDHDKITEVQSSSQVLLLLINNTPKSEGIITGKLYEYIFSGRPILAIGPVNGDAGRILKETNTGVIVDFNDKTSIKSEIAKLYELYESGKLTTRQSKNLEKYSRKHQAIQYCALLEKSLSE